MNVKMTYAYDGTRYAGSQIQENAVAVENELVRAIHRVTGEDVRLISAGRTDAGVHAEGMVSNFRMESPIPMGNLPYALNDQLPDDIRVRECVQVAEDFHARYDARRKTYLYRIMNARYISPLRRLYGVQIYRPLDERKMANAAKIFLGRHDFTSFMSAKSKPGTNPVRTIDEIRVERVDDEILLFFTAESFLYNQVRIMAGALVGIGAGDMDEAELGKILAAKDRARAGHTFPAKGLTLLHIEYDAR